MKLFQLSIKVFLAVTWIVLASESAFSQSGNMSDITLPSPDAIVSEPPVDNGNDGGSQPPAADNVEPDVVEGQTPVADDVEPEVVDNQTPVADDIEPDVAEGQTPVADNVEPEVVENPTPTVDDIVDALDEQIPTVDNVVDALEEQTPTVDDIADVVEGQTPTVDDVVDALEEQIPTVDNVVDALEGQTPTADNVDVVEGQNPVDDVEPEVVENPTPVAGDVEPEIAENQTPTTDDVEPDIAEGQTPAADNVEPDLDLAEGSTAQDLDLSKNPSNNTNLTTSEDSFTSEISETSDSNVNTEIESSDSLNSEPVDIKSDVAEGQIATPPQDEVSTEIESADVLNSDPKDIESNVVESEVADQSQEEIAVETDSQTTSDSQDIKESTESDEIVEELVEDVELRDKLSANETEEEVAVEEVAEDSEIEESTTDESSQEEEEVAEEKISEPDLGQLDRVAYETQFQEAPNDLAILMQEEFQLTQLMDSSGLELYGTVPSVGDISRRLAQLAEQTGKKPAFINISLQSNQLESFVVLPEQTQANLSNSVVASSNLNVVEPTQSKTSAIRKTVGDTSRKNVLAAVTQFREEVSDVKKLGQASYMESAQELYRVLIEPIEAELEANDIDILVFSMDSGLRLLPLAALHDGEQFLVEKYAMGMVPSFGLTDTRYVSPEQSSILAMGASEFAEQAALPTMPIELNTIVRNPRQGELFINEQFTISNFVAQNSRETPFSIIHLGTHAEFKAGNLNDSYIQFYDDKLKIPQLRKLSDQLGWNTSETPIELLVLSACETALGDKEAELGFAGLAVQAGVKSALASLWYVSDLGTLALMGEFYDQLDNTLIKAEALRQTQLEMIRGNVKVDDQQVKLSNGADLPLPEDFPKGTLSLAHPYFWSSFTLIGNWN